MVALHDALERLSRDGEFSGAVVIYGTRGPLFAKGYGVADPVTGRRFRPDTRVDSASLAKPITAAAVLLLARQGRLDLDAPVQRYLAEYPHAQATIRHLLAHSAGLPGYDVLEPLANKTNRDMLVEIGRRGLPPAFTPGSRFSYCNTCYNALALLIERVTGRPYLDFIQRRLSVPRTVTVRPQALADWRDRALGFRLGTSRRVELADSYEGEAFYGSANLSISAVDLAAWGSRWWSGLTPIRRAATAPAAIGPGVSGLRIGSWYCAGRGETCHYLGHHEGFHHMLYWDARRRISIAMVTNNSLPPGLQQRLQRAIVAFAEGRSTGAQVELRNRLPAQSPAAGRYRAGNGEALELAPSEGPVMKLTRRRVDYDLYPIGSGIGYAPGLDAYFSSDGPDRLRLLTLYEDVTAERMR